MRDLKRPIKLSIKTLILSLFILAIVGTFIGSLFSSIIVSKNNLEKNYLIENRYYAEKLAITTDELFSNMIKSLTMETKKKEFLTGDSKVIQKELQHTFEATTFFNSVYFINKTGSVVASAPELGLVGTKVTSIGVQEALKKKIPLISKPYVGVTKNLLLLISVPVFDNNGIYKGFIGGTIYLHKENSLKKVLGQHPKHENDSYVYVVDSEGNLIYHPDKNRINDNVIDNKVVQQALKGRSGYKEIINTKGVSMLAGYASASSTSKWGIVSQTPKKAVIKPTIEMAKQVSIIAIPFMLFVFLLSLFMLKKIVNPIRNLANYAKQITLDPSISKPHIPDWYFELEELKRAILLNVDFYQRKLTYVESESNLDPLTGYYNRRFLEKKIGELEMYSIILFDIDHFKKVNDQYGHQMGDEVLIYLSNLVREETRKNDLCFRIGGEEFLIVLPETGIEVTQTIAERIRKKTETTICLIGKPITLSLGVGSLPNTAYSFQELFSKADKALYKAKREGRNRVVIAKNLNNIA